MLTSEEINCLGQLTNSTWGYAGGLNRNMPTAGIKVSLQGDTMTCTFTTIVNLMSDKNLRDQCKRFEEESVGIIKEYMKQLKSEFKKESGRSLSAKETNTSDSIEVITVSSFTPKRTAYYRRFTTYQVG